MNEADDTNRAELVESVLDEALADFAGLLPAELMAELRASLADRLAAHPDGRAMVRRALPDAQVDHSGDIVRDATAEDAEDAEDADAAAEEAG